MNTEALFVSGRRPLSSSHAQLRGRAANRVETMMIPFGTVASWRQAPAGTTLRVVSGIVWVTNGAGAEDHVLGAGQSFDFGNSAAIVAESLLGHATVELFKS